MKTTSFSINSFLAYLVARIPGQIAQFITLSSDSKIGKWYHSNGIYKFAIGERITLRARNIVGYGVRPEGIIKGYTPEGKYIIEMTTDKNGNFFQWMKTGLPTENAERISEEQAHFKWNIEYHFKLVLNDA